ncbi:unnamed protein product, partial [Aphanomyces euteiches]
MAEIVNVYDFDQRGLKCKGRIVLPPQTKIILLTIVQDIAVVVSTQVQARAIQTHMNVFKKSNLTKSITHRVFPREVILCDYGPTHRHLAMLHSDTLVDIYAFNEAYKVLEPVYSINLTILRLQSPFSRMVIFGGDNHGLALIDHEGRFQSYFIRSKQVSKLVEHLVTIGNNTKVVKVQGGVMLMTMDDMDE